MPPIINKCLLEAEILKSIEKLGSTLDDLTFYDIGLEWAVENLFRITNIDSNIEKQLVKVRWR